MKWWRLYYDVMDDPKVQRLHPVDFKHWVNLLCLAGKKGGTLPVMAGIAFALRITEEEATSVVNDLIEKKLIDQTNDGANAARLASLAVHLG
jgi:hypothetical protein